MSKQRRKNKDTLFCESAMMNNRTYLHYYKRLTELALSRFEWTGLPDTVDERFLEMCLYNDGACVFFQDEELGFLCLQVALGGDMSVYRIPKQRRAYAVNGYNNNLTEKNSVIIFNNYTRTNSINDIELFALRLYEIQRTIDVNVKAQKTPTMILCDEKQRLTMLNLYKQYDGNEPFIFGNTSLDLKGVTSISTNAPFVSDKLYDLKTQIWSEALTYLGISNMALQKKERLLSGEVNSSQGGVISSRYSPLEMRRMACKQINKMFGTNIWVDYRENEQEIVEKENGNDNVEENDNQESEV